MVERTPAMIPFQQRNIMYLPWEIPDPCIPPAKVISEIGCNHLGQIQIAKEMIKHAKLAGAYAAKFQKRCMAELFDDARFNAPHPNPQNSFGETYGKHREFLEFSVEQHAELKDFCDKEGIVYSTSVWDKTSAAEIIGINPSFIKVPSATNTNLDVLRVLRDDYRGEVHISTGMSTREEVDAFVAFFEEKKAARDRLVMYSCVSGYPVPHHEVHLLDIRVLCELYGHRVKAIGFSGHHMGIALDIAAFVLGAAWIERHFTLDRTWKGTDHAASLEPQGLQHLVRDINAVALAWSEKPTGKILDIEAIQRNKLKHKA